MVIIQGSDFPTELAEVFVVKFTKYLFSNLENENDVSLMLNLGNITKDRKNKIGYCEISKQVIFNESYEMLLKELKPVLVCSYFMNPIANL